MGGREGRMKSEIPKDCMRILRFCKKLFIATFDRKIKLTLTCTIITVAASALRRIDAVEDG